MRKTITIDKEVHKQLRKYKNAKSVVKDKDLSFSNAIQELLDDSTILAEWMGTKKSKE